MDSRFDKSTLVTESYFWRKWELLCAQKMKPIFRDLGAYNLGSGEDVYADDWHRNNHVIRLNPRSHKAGNFLRFRNHSYLDKQESHGQTVTIESDSEEVDGWGYSFDQRKLLVPYHIDIHDEVERHFVKTHRLESEVRFDQTLEVGGQFYGVDVKSTTSLGTTENIEDGKEDTEGHKQSLEYHGTLLAGRGLILTAKKTGLITETPVVRSGYLNCEMGLDFQDDIGTPNHATKISHLLFGNRRHKHRSEYWFPSILDVVRFFRGYDPDNPGMAAFLSVGYASDESRAAVAWLEDKANRRAMNLHSTIRTEFDNFAQIVPTPMEPLADQDEWDRKRKAYFEGTPELEIEAEARADESAEEASDRESGTAGE